MKNVAPSNVPGCRRKEKKRKVGEPRDVTQFHLVGETSVPAGQQRASVSPFVEELSLLKIKEPFP